MTESNPFNRLRSICGRLFNKADVPEALACDADAELVMENKSRIDRALYFEAARALHRRWIRFAEIAFGVLLLSSGLAGSYIFLTVTGAIITALCLISWQVVARKDFSLLREKHGGEEWQKTVRFYSNRIETENGTGWLSTFHYENIKRCCETKHMLIIDFGKKSLATMMCKDGFTLGTYELAKSFILEMRN